MSKDFCHLHVHTEYSILDGINKVPDLCKYVKDQGMSACAITDHGVLYGVIEFYKNAKKNGINPLIGIEAYLTEDEDGIEDNKHKTRDNFHCIMVAQNEVGLRNLFWLTNRANESNFYYRPRISIKHLEAGRAEGIVATSSCLGGIASKLGRYNKQSADDGTFDDPDRVVVHQLARFASIFPNRFYAEVQDNPEFWEQKAYNRWLVQNATDMGIPLVITSDAHFLTKDDKETHNLIMAQQLKMTLEEYKNASDEDGLVYGNGHYIRSPEEMYQAALKYKCEEAFWNTIEIAKGCDVDITLGEYENPMFDITREDDYQEFQTWKATEYECL
jgi:DNA polymerase-3 subunit alpha